VGFTDGGGTLALDVDTDTEELDEGDMASVVFPAPPRPNVR